MFSDHEDRFHGKACLSPPKRENPSSLSHLFFITAGLPVIGEETEQELYLR